ncbi:MAG TPA: transcription antitermination factor NusB [Candidatus Paceibacterota bacterium]
MSQRHLARSLVMQGLYARDFALDQGEEECFNTLMYTVNEYAKGMDNPEFVYDLYRNIIRKIAVLDEVIQKAAPQYPIQTISGVDRNVMRIGLYELLFGDYDQVPPKVAITEAIVLAKTFGGENSNKFVNGVLGTIYRELGEPQKDHKPEEKKDVVDDADLPVLKKAGGFIYTVEDGMIYVVLVHDIFGFWTFSKGGQKEGEDLRQAAARALQEELGITVTPQEEIGMHKYTAHSPTEGKVIKEVTYYLCQAPERSDLVIGDMDGGIIDARWFSLDEITDLRMYSDVVKIVGTALEIIAEKHQDLVKAR